MAHGTTEATLSFRIAQSTRGPLLPFALSRTQRFKDVTEQLGLTGDKVLRVNRTKWALNLLDDAGQWNTAMLQLQACGNCTIRVGSNWQFRAWQCPDVDAPYEGTLEQIPGSYEVWHHAPRVFCSDRALTVCVCGCAQTHLNEDVPAVPETAVALAVRVRDFALMAHRFHASLP